MEKAATSIYSFCAKDVKGKEVCLGEYSGFVLLIANVASRCSYTSDGYNLFKELSEKYYAKGLRILLFPCNQVFPFVLF